jgi:DNA-binding NtrC family response regulator
VSATHRDLGAMVADGRFREDLYYRLSTFPIHLPPLRSRRDDIALLAESLLSRVAAKRRLRLAPAALVRLMAHPFPGNVRELRNVLERAALLSDGEVIEESAVERALSAGPAPLSPAALRAEPLPLKASELEALRAAAAAHRGTREELARALGISVRSLYRKLRALESPGTAH